MFYWRQPPWNILDFLLHANSDKIVPKHKNSWKAEKVLPYLISPNGSAGGCFLSSTSGKGKDVATKQGNRRLQATIYFLAIQVENTGENV